MNALTIDTKAIASSVAALQSVLPVPLKPITSKAQYGKTVQFLNVLIDQVGDSEDHRLMFLLEAVAHLIETHEVKRIKLPDSNPAHVLGFLMEQNKLKQADLAAEIGAQSVVSSILSGKREINGRQAKALGKRFGVSADAFL
jgi:HTH-type transcriptional regulator / antitoxin HigA